jgi:hypothetical protein
MEGGLIVKVTFSPPLRAWCVTLGPPNFWSTLGSKCHSLPGHSWRYYLSFLESRQNGTKHVNYFAAEYVGVMNLQIFFFLCCVHIFTSEYCYFHRWASTLIVMSAIYPTSTSVILISEKNMSGWKLSVRYRKCSYLDIRVHSDIWHLQKFLRRQ